METQLILAPTLTASAAAEAPWDVLVIGAGPAGSLAARQLAGFGARTLLVDRQQFPRPKVCGGCLNRQALSVLQRVGLSGFVRELNAEPLRQVQLHCGNRMATLALPGGAAVSRCRFDAGLVRAAMCAGAAFLPETSARLCSPDRSTPEFRQVRLGSSRDRYHVALARVVLIADGLGRSSLPAAEFPGQIAAGAWIGLGTVMPAQAHLCEPETINMAIGRHGYVGMVRLEDNALGVAAAMDPDFVKQDADPATAVAQIVRECGLVAKPVACSTGWQGTVRLTRRPRRAAGWRVFLIGDAAGYVEPFTGEGIAWALSAAAAVTPLARRGIAAWSPTFAWQWQALHRRQIRRRQRVCWLLTRGIRYRRAVPPALSLLTYFPVFASLLVHCVSRSSARHEVGRP